MSIILIVGIIILAIRSLYHRYTQPLVPPRDDKEEDLADMEEPQMEASETVDKTKETDIEQMDIKIPDSTTRTSLMVALRKLNL